MNRSISLFVSLLLCSCVGRGSDNGGVQERIRPVKSTLAIASEVVERDFAGLSTPIDAVNLAFKIPGQILTISVVKGEEIVAGELLGQIDPIDVELQLAADRSSYEEAQSRYDRAKRLLEHEALSRQEVESAEAIYTRAKSAYDNTREMLQQTALRAPFSAIVERVYVDTYQRVQAGETIMRIVSPTTRNVEFTLPEGYLKSMRDTTTRFDVNFDNLPSVNFAADVIEYARTSSDASGFPVTLRLKDVGEYNIRSGMSCTITMFVRQSVSDAVILPLSAIYAPTSGGSYVWVIDSDDRVRLQSVVLGQPTGRESIMINSGVNSGERIVTAGVYQLREGDRVKILSAQ